MVEVPDRKKGQLGNGFMNRGYLLVFQVADAEKRRALVELCEGEWQGDRITDAVWEITNDLEPDEMEQTVASLLGDGDRAAYYYLTDAKRMFRVVIA